jgi:aspartate/methionine/tyrosine aminotransferase
VDYNLTESGVHPLSLRELLDDDEEDEQLERLLRTELGYIQTNGTEALRAAIAALYAAPAGIDEVLVTAGSAEANLLLAFSQIEPGDQVLVQRPNFMQLEGLLRAFGAEVRTFHLVEALGWQPELEQLRARVTDRTRLIALTNPNNPTGARLSAEARRVIVELAERSGAWIVADEIYRGAELDGATTPSFWGATERVIVTGGLSKAYGLPGLRVGWLLAPPDLTRQIWRYHDYTTIALPALSDRLGRLALEPARRARILGRTCGIIRRNLGQLGPWLDERGWRYRPPEAGAILFCRHDLPVGSTELVTRLRDEQSVLLVPGDHFGMEGYLRFGLGEEPVRLERALERVARGLAARAG